MKLRVMAFAAACVLAVASLSSAQTFNEVRISSPGAEDDVSNFFELFDVPGTSLDGLSVIVVSSEFAPGSINNAFDLTGTSIGADGFYLAGDATEYPDADLDTTGTDYFGSPANFLLVDGFTGVAGDDLDAVDDGVIDNALFTSVIDSLFMDDGDSDGTTAFDYGGGDSVGPDGTFTPAHVFRDVDGGGTWQIGEFGDRSFDTPGLSNVAIPEPSSIAVLGLIGLAGLGRRRR